MKIPAAKIVFNEDDREVLKHHFDNILTSGQLVLGKYTKKFEEAFASFLGVDYAVAVSGGTSALEIIFRCLNLAGSDIIVPTNTFFATPAAGLHAGANVVFADCDENLQLSLDSLQQVVNQNTKAVVIVHIGGFISSQMIEIRQFCDKRGLVLIEDAAHAHGSSLNGVMAGRFGRAAAFSFFPTKIITAGEGGMIVTNDKDLAERARVFRDQGKRLGAGNIHDELGYNWRISEFHAAIGLQHFSHLVDFIVERQQIANKYKRELVDDSWIKFLAVEERMWANFYKLIVFPQKPFNRNKLKSQIKNDCGVSLSGEVYELPCHQQPVFANCCRVRRQPVNAERLCAQHLCLPIYQGMTSEEISFVIHSLRRYLS